MREIGSLALLCLLGCGGGPTPTPSAAPAPRGAAPQAATTPASQFPQYVLPGAPAASSDMDRCGALRDSQDRCGPVAALSAQVPGGPCDPGSDDWTASDNAMANFAWKTLVALAWPAKAGARGVAAPDVRPGHIGPSGPSPTVFETWRSRDELTALVTAGEVTASDWDKDAPLPAECGSAPTLPVLRATSKVSREAFGGLPPGASDASGGPVVDQNRNVVLIDTRFNRVIWDVLIARGVGRGVGATEAASFPHAGVEAGRGEGAIAVQSAWMQLDPAQPVEGAMHTRDVLLFQPGTEEREAVCDRALVGLLGVQISHKLPDGNWAFTVFEYDGAVPDDASVPYPLGGPGCDSATPAICAAAQRGQPAPATDCCPNHDHNGALGVADRLLAPRQPTILTRVDPVGGDPSCNDAYRAALSGGPWGRMRHIGTQYIQEGDDGPESTPKTLRSPLFEPFLVAWVDGVQRVTSDCLWCHRRGDDFNFVMTTFAPR